MAAQAGFRAHFKSQLVNRPHLLGRSRLDPPVPPHLRQRYRILEESGCRRVVLTTNHNNTLTARASESLMWKMMAWENNYHIRVSVGADSYFIHQSFTTAVTEPVIVSIATLVIILHVLCRQSSCRARRGSPCIAVGGTSGRCRIRGQRQRPRRLPGKAYSIRQTGYILKERSILNAGKANLPVSLVARGL